jgi:hypothetical protein
MHTGTFEKKCIGIPVHLRKSVPVCIFHTGTIEKPLWKPLCWLNGFRELNNETICIVNWFYVFTETNNVFLWF